MPKDDYTSGYNQTDQDNAPEFTFASIFPTEDIPGVGSTALTAVEWLHKTPNALVIDGELAEGEWLDLLRGIEKIKRRYQWYLGDALVYGITRKYGTTEDQIAQVVEITGKDNKTLHDYYKTALLFELSERSDNLEFEQHRILAREFSSDTPDDRAERLRWLHIAEINNLSGRKLKAEIAKAQLPAEVTPEEYIAQLQAGMPDGVTVEYMGTLTPLSDEIETDENRQRAIIKPLKSVKKTFREFAHHIENDTLHEMPRGDLYSLLCYFQDKYNQRRKMGE